MTELYADPAIPRALMVDSQVRPNQVSDARVISAMRALPREDFAPPGARVYADADIALGGGRFLLAPMTIARLTQLVLRENPKSVLVIGAGAGYGAAILAFAGARVTALESDPGLDTGALAKYAPAVTSAAGPLTEGFAEDGPYDAIFIEGAVPKIPVALAAQLAPGGRLVTILADRGSPGRGTLGQAIVAESRGQGFATLKMFDCTARILPEFQPAPAFVF
jgi:protein-L-isoaspartate(D-aspartate) O-methyltransferase